MAPMHIAPFYDAVTGTVSYVLADTAAGQAAIIDPVLDFDPKSGTLGSTSTDRLIDYVRTQGWQLQWVVETHAHADHISGAQHVRHHLGGQLAIGAHIRTVQQLFRGILHFERSFVPNGGQFDRLLEDGDTLAVGGLTLTALHVPGHTPADLALHVQGLQSGAVQDAVQDAVFVGDTLFMPDVGTARADFPGGDAAQLYRSIQRLLALPPATQLYVCHDYPPAGRAPAFMATVAEQKAHSIHVHDGVTEAQFVAMRQARDATLAMPTLILPSVQVNLRGGRLPPAADDGRQYLQVPINAFAGTTPVPDGL